MSSNGTNDNIDLRFLTEEELAEIQKFADEAEKLAEKAQKSKEKAKKAYKDISDEAKKFGIGGGPSDIGGRDSRKRSTPIDSAAGENAFGHDFGKSPIGGQRTRNVPRGMEERLEKAEKEASQAEKDAKEALKRAQAQEEKFRDFQDKYQQALSGFRNPFGFVGNKITGALGKAGLYGMIALFGEEVVTDMFDLVKSWFDTPGGIFDIRKKIKDAVYNIGDLQYQEEIQNGNVFFTADTRLYQHSPYHSNQEHITQYQMRYLDTSKYD